MASDPVEIACAAIDNIYKKYREDVEKAILRNAGPSTGELDLIKQFLPLSARCVLFLLQGKDSFCDDIFSIIAADYRAHCFLFQKSLPYILNENRSVVGNKLTLIERLQKTNMLLGPRLSDYLDTGPNAAIVFGRVNHMVVRLFAGWFTIEKSICIEALKNISADGFCAHVTINRIIYTFSHYFEDPKPIRPLLSNPNTPWIFKSFDEIVCFLLLGMD